LEEFHPQVHYFLEKACLVINSMDLQPEAKYGFITAYESIEALEVLLSKV